MENWLSASLEYIQSWLAYQMRFMEQPGCTVSVTHQGKLVLEEAFGYADLSGGVPMTARHRFRVGSHSKTFTAVALLKLRDMGRLRLDDPVGRYVSGLQRTVGETTIAQLLSHSAGLLRDGTDAGQWVDRRPFLDAESVRRELAEAPVVAPGSRFKYSHLGFALAGMVIEAITGETYREWVTREILEPSGLSETLTDAPLPSDIPFARGHSAKLPLNARLTIDGEASTEGLTAAAGFASTASDLARFYASLSPTARESVLSVESRSEMTQRQTQMSAARWYGFGTMGGSLADWTWFGHVGAFPGYTSRTLCVPELEIAISVLTNAVDGAARDWVDGLLHIMRAYAQYGAPSAATVRWHGRWWSLWGAVDLLAMKERVLVASPAMRNPVHEASVIEVDQAEEVGTAYGRIASGGAWVNAGEAARIISDASGRPYEFWLAGVMMQKEECAARELLARYGLMPSPPP